MIPVLSSTFASVGRFLKHAGNMSLGMLIIDESGQAVPQSALGAIYRTKAGCCCRRSVASRTCCNNS